jgi:hypothetical protein
METVTWVIILLVATFCISRYFGDDINTRRLLYYDADFMFKITAVLSNIIILSKIFTGRHKDD